jgi:membrane protein implicated in regulation of membrane protease activity
MDKKEAFYLIIFMIVIVVVGLYIELQHPTKLGFIFITIEIIVIILFYRVVDFNNKDRK